MQFQVTLERNRSDHDRYMTFIRYEMEDGQVVPYRYTYIVGRRGLICERITRVAWPQISREPWPEDATMYLNSRPRYKDAA